MTIYLPPQKKQKTCQLLPSFSNTLSSPRQIVRSEGFNRFASTDALDNYKTVPEIFSQWVANLQCRSCWNKRQFDFESRWCYHVLSKLRSTIVGFNSESWPLAGLTGVGGTSSCRHHFPFRLPTERSQEGGPVNKALRGKFKAPGLLRQLCLVQSFGCLSVWQRNLRFEAAHVVREP